MSKFKCGTIASMPWGSGHGFVRCDVSAGLFLAPHDELRRLRIAQTKNKMLGTPFGGAAVLFQPKVCQVRARHESTALCAWQVGAQTRTLVHEVRREPTAP